MARSGQYTRNRRNTEEFGRKISDEDAAELRKAKKLDRYRNLIREDLPKIDALGGEHHVSYDPVHHHVNGISYSEFIRCCHAEGLSIYTKEQEKAAAQRAYNAGLGASEWQAFV